MKRTAFQKKTTRQADNTSARSSTVGHAVASIEPPEYGIDFVDQENGDPRYSENRTGLPGELKAGAEALSGVSLDDIRVHYNSQKPAQLQALAYSHGNKIYVGSGQERHLPHETWHVVQQKRGRVKPTLRVHGIAINDDASLEHEATVMGTRALTAGSSDTGVSTPLQTVAQDSQSVTQMKTNLIFDQKRTGADRILEVRHDRSAVNSIAVKWVLANGEWREVPGRTVCNHSKGYLSIFAILSDGLKGETVSDAADRLLDIYGDLKNNGQGLDTPTSTHQKRLKAVKDVATTATAVDELDDSFNYFIYKIADYPRNLFFWPEKTNSDPDEPEGEYWHMRKPTGWEFHEKKTPKATHLNDEKERIKEGREDLISALR